MKCFLTFLFFLVLSINTQSQTHEPLTNIRPGTADGIPPYTSSVFWDGLQYFVSYGQLNSSNIWSTDATPENTKALFEEDEFYDIRHLSSTAFSLIFNSYQIEEGLFASDGTQAGTTLIRRFPGQTIEFMARLNDEAVIFITKNFADDVTALWVTDGTSQGTTYLDEFDLGSLFITPTYYKDNVILNERNQGSNFPPVITDGTPQGTMLVVEYVNDLLSEEVPFVYSAVGTTDFIFFKTGEGGQIGKVFNGNSVQDILLPGNVYDAIQINQYHVLFADEGVVVYDSMKNDYEDLELEPDLFSIPIRYDDMVYFHDEIGHVYQTDGTFNGTMKVSTMTTGNLNFAPSLHAHLGSVYYNRNTLTAMELRAINISTGIDKLFATVQSTTDQLVRPRMFSFDYNLVYDKTATAEGREFWVYAPYPTAVTQVDKNNFNITLFPNPVQDKIWISFKDEFPIGANMTIHNISGRQRMTTFIRDKKLEIDVQFLTPGLYFLKVESEGELRTVASFVKR